VHPGETIEVWGDSLSFGAQPVTRLDANGKPKAGWIKSPFAWPEVLARDYGLTLLKHVSGGLTSGDLVKVFNPSNGVKTEFVMIGTNDCLVHWREEDQSASIVRYTSNIETLHQMAASKGKRIVWLVFPPVKAMALDNICSRYRQALSSVALRLGDQVIEPTGIDRPVKEIWLDGLHLTDDGYRQLASAISRHICMPAKP
jgi:lysophospholipase L1-like esterase